MQVSAISSETGNTSFPVETLSGNSESSKVFTSAAKTEQNKDNIFYLINEWKNFCIAKESESSFDYLA